MYIWIWYMDECARYMWIERCQKEASLLSKRKGNLGGKNISHEKYTAGEKPFRVVNCAHFNTPPENSQFTHWESPNRIKKKTSVVIGRKCHSIVSEVHIFSVTLRGVANGCPYTVPFPVGRQRWGRHLCPFSAGQPFPTGEVIGKEVQGILGKASTHICISPHKNKLFITQKKRRQQRLHPNTQRCSQNLTGFQGAQESTFDWRKIKSSHDISTDGC